MFNFIVLTSSRRARGCPWKKKFEKMSNFLAYNTPRPPMSVHKNFQPNRPSRTDWAENKHHIYTNVLFYYIDLYLRISGFQLL